MLFPASPCPLMPGSFFNSLIYKAFGGMTRRKIAWLRVRIPRSPPYLIDFIELIRLFPINNGGMHHLVMEALCGSITLVEPPHHDDGL